MYKRQKVHTNILKGETMDNVIRLNLCNTLVTLAGGRSFKDKGKQYMKCYC